MTVGQTGPAPQASRPAFILVLPKERRPATRWASGLNRQLEKALKSVLNGCLLFLHRVWAWSRKSALTVPRLRL
jgi:hypothetical protein